MGQKHEVALVGLGPMGIRIGTAVAAKRSLRVASAIDPAPTKVGRTLTEVMGVSVEDVIVGRSIDDLPTPSDGAVAVLSTFSSVEAITPQVEALLSRGYNVLSTCEELSAPALQPALALRLDHAARAADRSVLGSGINPGFLLDTVPLLLSTVCTSVERVYVRRVLDTNRRRLPLQLKVGVGMGEDEFRERASRGQLGHVGLKQSATLVASGLGWTLDHYEETLEPVLARADMETAAGRVLAGAVIGQHQVGIATGGGRELIRYELDMYADAAATDEVTLEGVPSIKQVIEGGVNGDAGTSAVIANLVPAVSHARPGLLTMLDLMVLAGTGA